MGTVSARHRLALAATLACVALAPARVAAQGADGEAIERPTVQRRFAPKANLLMAQLSAMTHVRDDFYRSWGYGLDVAYFPMEWLGVELRAVKLNTSLDAAAIDLKERIGLTPDARPQDAWLQLGVRYAPGYGKLLMWESFVLHFDPQLVVHGGVASAEARWLPTFNVALSLLGHLRWGLKLKVDLGMSVQGERRERGWVWTTGFAPSLGLGWGWNL